MSLRLVIDNVQTSVVIVAQIFATVGTVAVSFFFSRSHIFPIRTASELRDLCQEIANLGTYFITQN